MNISSTLTLTLVVITSMVFAMLLPYGTMVTASLFSYNVICLTISAFYDDTYVNMLVSYGAYYVYVSVTNFVTAVNFMNGDISRPVGMDSNGNLGLTNIRTGRANNRVVMATVTTLVTSRGTVCLKILVSCFVNSMTFSMVVEDKVNLQSVDTLGPIVNILTTA